ncbi:cell division protein ZapC [Psychrosphaera sp. F3M07]|uniref:cell division protein ZapC domain-containing protein n=1 Tax=Psychrosphaera sp. F3M07 TaxID=2841560 RepID=UPI001C089092|nr:cell division protein ZapC domain-containing protein [Psychrosphaera sp. F3M07]MBU2916499.1 cell division protein ZapC [Psychrosphaera sp. F3M07]
MQNNLVNWYWKIDVNSEQLVLCLSSDIHFPTLFCRQQVSSLTSPQCAFTTEDAELYSAFRDLLGTTNLNQEAQFTLAINATAACNYLTPCATKSWFFETLSKDKKTFECGDIVETQSLTLGYYLVLDSDPLTSTIILLSQKQQVDSNRVFNQGQVLKVHNDRLEKKSNIELLTL